MTVLNRPLAPRSHAFSGAQQARWLTMEVIDDLSRTPAWMRDAACGNRAVDVFFPESDADAAAAKAICARCTVRDACLEYALDLPDLAGVWGGATMSERRRLRRV